jgi:DNA mismatch repair ATPase MutS
MRLDAAASRALNVLPQRLDGSASFSLYGIMARGKTAMGKRLLKVPERELLAACCACCV